MAYSVFVSHGAHDQGLVMTLANTLSKHGVGVKVAEWYIAAGQTLSDKVRAQIEGATRTGPEPGALGGFRAAPSGATPTRLSWLDRANSVPD